MENERRFDLIVFGASGVTGKCIVEELAVHEKIKFAVAGRDQMKLKSIIAEIAEITGKNLDAVEIIVADVALESTLVSMCSQTKILLNCVGPYRFYGEQVVQACLESGTHYIDVSGEPQFLENMQLKYFDEANKKGLYVIGACGFDSIPCDMGVQFLKQHFVEDEKHSGHANSVESYLEVHPAKDSKANFATWQSAIHSFAHMAELKPIRKRLQESLFPSGYPKFDFPLDRRPLLFKSEVTGKWCVPFVGSDKSIVNRSQMYDYQYKGEKPVQIQTYMCLPSLLYAMLYLFMGMIFVVLAKFNYGRYLLEEYPEFFSCGVFTKKSIPKEQLTGGSFTMTLCGRGWSRKTAEHECPDKDMKVTVTGPGAGYVTTSICAIAACSTLLDEEERKKMPQGGGVFTPGAAFAKTSMTEKLMENGVMMTVGASESHAE